MKTPAVTRRWYQPECDRCNWVGDVHEYKQDAEEQRKAHDCLLEGRPGLANIYLQHLHTDDSGVWAWHKGLQQVYLLVPQEGDEFEYGELT